MCMNETSPSCTFSCVSCPESQYFRIPNRLHVDIYILCFSSVLYLLKTSPNYTLLTVQFFDMCIDVDRDIPNYFNVLDLVGR